MRELTFDLSYERGVDRFADVFVDHPGLELASLACASTDRRVWRLDRVTGPPAAVAELDVAMADVGCCLGNPGASCDGEHYHETLSRGDDRRLVYTRHLDGEPAPSIPVLAVRHFGDGLLFRNERSGDRVRWRIVMPDGVGTRTFRDAVRERLADGVAFDFGHVGRATDWEAGDSPRARLSAEQRAALDAAAERGYYELPREVELDDLAAELDVPRSTLSYRLRRAEAQLAEAFLDR